MGMCAAATECGECCGRVCGVLRQSAWSTPDGCQKCYGAVLEVLQKRCSDNATEVLHQAILPCPHRAGCERESCSVVGEGCGPCGVAGVGAAQADEKAVAKPRLSTRPTGNSPQGTGLACGLWRLE